MVANKTYKHYFTKLTLGVFVMESTFENFLEFNAKDNMFCKF